MREALTRTFPGNDSIPGEFFTDVKTLRERARQHIERGAVTNWILAMEEEHADDLANLLATLDPIAKAD